MFCWTSYNEALFMKTRKASDRLPEGSSLSPIKLLLTDKKQTDRKGVETEIEEFLLHPCDPTDDT